MILSIARKEFIDTWRDGRFRWAAAIIVGLLGVALLLALQQVQRARSERTAASALERENWLNQGQKNSHSAGHYGVYVFKPLPPLAMLDRGIEPFVGTTVFLEAHRQNQAAFLPAQDATAIDKRLVSTLPFIHIALVATASLTPDMPTWLTQVQPMDSGYLSLITGPSRTADIERVLTIGVHGPERLIIIFIDELGGTH